MQRFRQLPPPAQFCKLILALAGTLGLGLAHADTTWQVTGHVTSVTGTLFPDAIIGDAMSMLITVADAAAGPDQFPDEISAFYNGGATAMTITVGGHDIVIPLIQPHVTMTNDGFAPGGLLHDRYSLSIDGNVPEPPDYGLSGGLVLEQFSPVASLLNSDDYVTIPANWGIADTHQMSIRASQAHGGVIASVTSNIESITPVPLPAAGWLLFSGIAGMGGFVGRKSV